MARGVGVDIESLASFRRSATRAFKESYFSKREREQCRTLESLCGRFCAKEAVIKAFDKKVSIKDIEVVNAKSGRPEVFIRGKRRSDVKCSISHTAGYACACVVIS